MCIETYLSSVFLRQGYGGNRGGGYGGGGYGGGYGGQVHHCWVFDVVNNGFETSQTFLLYPIPNVMQFRPRLRAICTAIASTKT